MNDDVLSKLKSAKMLSEHNLTLGSVPTGSYAINRVLSGSFHGGYPIGGITELIGESSVGKTLFLTHLFKEAQAKGYYTIMLDNEFAYSPKFAESLGVDSKKLIYPDWADVCDAQSAFNTMKTIVKEIRSFDKDTPIVVGLDSMGSLRSGTESEREEGDLTITNMDGAIRAKEIGGLLRIFNPIIRRDKVCLVVINQYRINPGVMYGDPRRRAGGGNSLFYYCTVSNDVASGKGDKIKNEKGNIIGITGTFKNTKNKFSNPYRECKFYLDFEKGIDPYYGLLPLLEEEGIVTRAGPWYTVGANGAKLQSKDLPSLIEVKDSKIEPILSLIN